MVKKNIVDTAKQNITKLRIKLGLSQTELARKMKTSQRLIAYYESKAGNIPLLKLQDFADALNVSVGTLLDERSNPEEIGPDIDIRLLKRLKQIDKLPRRAKEALIHNINTTIEMHEMKQKTNQKKLTQKANSPDPT
jgi:transcriptional regulator with XRE-family HTH domain